MCIRDSLRKDFMIDTYQVYEAKAMGADCILIIISALSDTQAQDIVGVANEIGLDILVEVHDREELERGMVLRTPLIGINNRNLDDFSENLDLTIELSQYTPNDIVIISESGIRTTQDVRKLLNYHVDGILVGEAFIAGGFNKEKVSKKIQSFMIVE